MMQVGVALLAAFLCGTARAQAYEAVDAEPLLDGARRAALGHGRSSNGDLYVTDGYFVSEFSTFGRVHKFDRR